MIRTKCVDIDQHDVGKSVRRSGTALTRFGFRRADDEKANENNGTVTEHGALNGNRSDKHAKRQVLHFLLVELTPVADNNFEKDLSRIRQQEQPPFHTGSSG